MGTIAEKLSYLDETREQILTNIQALGGDLTEESTFRSYADALDEVWEEQDHVTGTGTELSLSTKKGKMKVELSPSELEQATTSGKNLFNINGTYARGNATISRAGNTLTQVNTGAYGRSIWTINGLIIGTKYTVSLNYSNANSSPITIQIRNSEDNITIGTTSTTNTSGEISLTFEAEETIHVIRLYSNSSNTANTYTVLFNNIQLEVGETATDYEEYTGRIASPNPQYPQEIHTVSGENTIVSTGKNLFSTNYSDYNTTSDTYGFRKIVDEIPSGKYLVISLTDNDTSVTLSSSFYLMLTSDGTLSSSSRKSPIVAGNISTSPASFYTTELKYISFYPKDEETFNKLLQRYKVQYELRDNTTPTTYEPHQEQTYPLSLGDLEYCKIGDYEDLFFKNVVGSEYYDSTLELDKWYLKKNIGKTTINSSSYNSFITTYTNLNVLRMDKFSGDKKNGNQQSSIPWVSNKFKYIIREGTYDSPNFINCIYDSANYYYFLGLPKTIDTVEKAIEYVGVYELYYILKNITNILLSDTLQTQLEAIWRANSYEEQTNVSQENNDLPFVINAKALGIGTENSTLSLNSLNTMSLNPRLNTEIVEPTIEEQEESVEGEEQ